MKNERIFSDNLTVSYAKDYSDFDFGTRELNCATKSDDGHFLFNCERKDIKRAIEAGNITNVVRNRCTGNHKAKMDDGA